MGCFISDNYNNYKSTCNARFAQLKANKEDLNRIFIDIYGLEGELTPKVADKDVKFYDTEKEYEEDELLNFVFW